MRPGTRGFVSVGLPARARWPGRAGGSGPGGAREPARRGPRVGEDGRGTQVPPGTTIRYTVRDLYDRPWARIWEEYFERGMKRPVAADDLGGFK